MAMAMQKFKRRGLCRSRKVILANTYCTRLATAKGAAQRSALMQLGQPGSCSGALRASVVGGGRKQREKRDTRRKWCLAPQLQVVGFRAARSSEKRLHPPLDFRMSDPFDDDEALSGWLVAIKIEVAGAATARAALGH